MVDVQSLNIDWCLRLLFLDKEDEKLSFTIDYFLLLSISSPSAAKVSW